MATLVGVEPTVTRTEKTDVAMLVDVDTLTMVYVPLTLLVTTVLDNTLREIYVDVTDVISTEAGGGWPLLCL